MLGNGDYRCDDREAKEVCKKREKKESIDDKEDDSIGDDDDCCRCRRRTLKVINSRPVLIAICTFVVIECACVLAELMVDLQGIKCECFTCLSLSTLRASLSGTFLLLTLPDLVTPLKGHSLSPRIYPPTRSAPSERFG